MSLYTMKRGWMDSPVFGKAPYSDREAWEWMISEARWKSGTENICGKPVHLKRGQFSDSVRFMAEKFQWSKDRVTRFLKRLIEWGMIVSETRTGQYIITICNYEQYQLNSDGNKDAPKDTGKDGVKDAPKDKQEEGKEGEEGNNYISWLPEKTWDAFLEMRKKQRKAPTPHAKDLLLARLDKLRLEGHDPQAVLEQSIVKSWLDVFPIKQDFVKQGQAPPKPKMGDESRQFTAKAVENMGGLQ